MAYKKSFLSLMILAMLFLFPLSVIAASLQVSWNANTETNLAGYKVYYGTTSGTYATAVNVGKVTSYTIPSLSTGKTYYVALTAYDTSSNESDKSTEISAYIPAPDTTPPTGSILIAGGDTTTPTRSVTLTLSAADAVGVTGMKISNDGTTWSDECTFSTSQAWVLTTGDGLKTVYAIFKDSAGNWSSAVSDTITLALDSDGDGITDAWETSNGLDATNADDAGLDSDGDGYTNIEEYYNGTDPQSANDSAPTVSAGSNQQSDPTRIYLNGTATDPNGLTLTYAWTQFEGDAVALVNANTANANFLAVKAGVYRFMLTCSNGKGSSSDTVKVTINNVAPTVSAGNDITINVGQRLVLSASGADANSDSLSYTWTFVQGPSISLPAMTTQTLSLTPQNAGSYKFSVKCYDGVNYSASDEVTVTVNAANQAPTADAGSDTTAQLGTTVTLDGQGSTDPDNNTLTYAWTKLSGPTVTLNNAQTANPNFTANATGTYIFQLIVNDGTVDSTPDTVTITVVSGNNAPSAYAGDNSTVNVGSLVTLDASGSLDPDGDTLSYTWSQVYGATMSLSNTKAMKPTFTPTVAGVLIFKLVVSDGQAQDEETVRVTVNSINHVPVADAGSGIAATIGQTVTLDGSASSDADGDALTYAWSQTAGTVVSLTNPNSTKPSFVPTAAGSYTFELTVSDGQATSDAASVTVSVQASTVSIQPISPVNGSTVRYNPTFKWSAQNLTTYTLYMKIGNGSYSQMYSGTAKSYTMPYSLWSWFIPSRYTIYWYVVGENGNQQVTSAVFKFKKK
ncbi:MAG: PKD domain-containing protein [Syntrophaceae bacterium]